MIAIMILILKIMLLIAALLLVLSILLQHRGSSLGGAFGADSHIFRSRRGAEKILYWLTIGFSILFLGITLIIAIVNK